MRQKLRGTSLGKLRELQLHANDLDITQKVVSDISLGDLYNKVRERELYLEEPENLGALPGRIIALRQE